MIRSGCRRCPPTWGIPDLVYLQGDPNPFGLLIWLDEDDAELIRLALHVLLPDSFGAKSAPEVVQLTEVNGRPALWMVGSHLFLLRSGAYEMRSLVEGNVLVWEFSETTYRLETGFSLEETRRIAESLR